MSSEIDASRAKKGAEGARTDDITQSTVEETDRDRGSTSNSSDPETLAPQSSPSDTSTEQEAPPPEESRDDRRSSSDRREAGPRPSETSKSDSGRGRPSEIDSPHRTTMTFEKSQVDYLDDACARMRLSGGQNTSRSELVRAMLGALEASNVDYTEVGTPAELRDLIESRLP